MTPATDSPPNVPVKSSSKKWLWGCGGCLVLLVVGGIAAGAIFFFGVLGVIKSTTPYQTALSKAQNSPEVQEALGTPINAGLIPSGSVNSNNGQGTAELTIPVSGPKGSAKVHYKGATSGDTWTADDLTVTLDANGKVIELQK